MGGGEEERGGKRVEKEMGCEEWDERERDRVVRVKEKEKEEG